MTFIIITILLFTLELIYFHIADRLNIIDKPNERSSHKAVVLRGGGIIFLFGAWLWAAFYGLQYPWFMAGLTLIAGISFADDIKSLPDSIRLSAHFIAMLMMFQDLGILNISDWWMIIIALIICVGITNAYNFMDGINGITGGYSLAVLLPLFYLNSHNETTKGFIEPSFLIVAILATLVFCFFNFRTKAKCFAGDVGSIAIAFIIVFALGKLILKTSDLSYIFLLVVYGVDAVLTICHRIMLHENLGQAHRKHAYQLMANELKIPHVKVSAFYTTIQFIISAGLILLLLNHWLYCIAVLIILSAAYIIFMRRYYHLHEEYLTRIE